MPQSKINDRWEIWLTDDRHEFHETRPGWEAERLASCFELMGEGDVVYDLGAESGDFTALYHLWVGPEGAVFPVEPSWPYWASIYAHWRGNELPELQGFFPGFASSLTDLDPPVKDATEHKTSKRPGSAWPRAAFGPIKPDFGFRHLAQQTNHTQQMTIDDMRGLFGKPPDHIVMDIEGAELRALHGAVDVMRKYHPTMWVSVHQQTMHDWYDDTLEDLIGWMAEFGYAGEKLGEGSEEYFVFR